MERNLTRDHRYRPRRPAATIIKTSKSNTSSACCRCFRYSRSNTLIETSIQRVVSDVIFAEQFVRTRKDWQTYPNALSRIRLQSFLTPNLLFLKYVTIRDLHSFTKM